MRKKMLWAVTMAAVLALQTAGMVSAEETETLITLSDEGIQVDGAEISTDSSASVYAGAEMIYYLAGQDAVYGEGDEEDGHTPEEAAEHTVVTITAPGTYRVPRATPPAPTVWRSFATAVCSSATVAR